MIPIPLRGLLHMNFLQQLKKLKARGQINFCFFQIVGGLLDIIIGSLTGINDDKLFELI